MAESHAYGGRWSAGVTAVTSCLRASMPRSASRALRPIVTSPGRPAQGYQQWTQLVAVA